MKVLVTGAAGRIGIEVTREFLSHGYQVRALDMRPIPRELRDLGAEAAYADAADPLQMLREVDGCEGLIHIAGNPYPTPTAAAVLDSNVKGTYTTLEAAQVAGIERAIITSSVWALGFTNMEGPIIPEYLPVDLQHPKKPVDSYGFSKYANEITADLFARQHGMTVITLCPAAVINLSFAAKKGWLRRGMENNLRQLRTDLWGYIDVYDMARLYRMAWEADLSPGSHTFHGMIDDVLCEATPKELIERFLPTLTPYADRVGAGFYDLSLTKEKLGFTAQMSWRMALEESEP